MCIIQVSYSEKFLLRKSVEALEEDAQGGGGIMVPGSVQETCRCCTE